MKLISCNNCGVVLNADKLEWPEAYDFNGYSVPGAEWSSDANTHVVPINCPVCKGKLYADD